MNIHEKRRKALEMRGQGKTFDAIGNELGVTRARARALFNAGLREENVEIVTWTNGLYQPWADTLQSLGFSCKDDIKKALDAGDNTLSANFTQKAIHRITAWLNS